MSATAHVYPVSEAARHITDGGDCPCQPATEPVLRDDGSNGWLVTHRRFPPPPYANCGRCHGSGVAGGWQGRCPQCGGAA